MNRDARRRLLAAAIAIWICTCGCDSNPHGLDPDLDGYLPDFEEHNDLVRATDGPNDGGAGERADQADVRRGREPPRDAGDGDLDTLDGMLDADSVVDADPDAPWDARPEIGNACTGAEVQILIGARCVDFCHNNTFLGTPMSLQGDFTRTTVGVVSFQADPMLRIEPGSRAESYLYHKLVGDHEAVGGRGVRMPAPRTEETYFDIEELECVGSYIDRLRPSR